MKNRLNSKKNPPLINRAGFLIKDNARIARDGMAFYLDTLWKLPGAYVAGRDQMSTEKLLRRQIKSFEDIYAIKDKIDESRTQINSIKEWVNLAKEGTWSKELREAIDDFGLTANELGEKVEMLGMDYRYFADSFLSCRKDALGAYFRAEGNGGNTGSSGTEVADCLMQVGLIEDRVEETLARAVDLERDVERFVDSKLSRSGKNAPGRGFRKTRVRGNNNPLTGAGDSVKRVVLVLKMAVLGLYYIANAFVFMIKYFILVPASFIEAVLGGLKKKNRGDQA